MNEWQRAAVLFWVIVIAAVAFALFWPMPGGM
jgi:hypothetical protein